MSLAIKCNDHFIENSLCEMSQCIETQHDALDFKLINKN